MARMRRIPTRAATAVAALLAVPAVAAVAPAGVTAPDAATRSDGVWQAVQWTAPTSPLGVHDAASIIGATSGPATGLDGSGVGIALVDTGVVPVPGLPASQIVNGPDLSFESQGPTERYLDTYGHGTHMAGIIVGDDPGSGLLGIAPKATVTSIKVGGADGTVDVSQMLAAINWTVQHRNDDPTHPIRVISLSYGTDTNQATGSDPLAYAAEQAWKAGIVVVVAGGNLGGNNAKLFMPAADPYVLAVGSNAVNGTPSAADDTLSTFSTISSSRSVDLTAPGESILSLRNPGSYVDTTYPTAEVGTDLFKGSGTSQATALVSGAVALLLQKRPTLTPDQVKALLKSTATPLVKTITGTAGLGEVNLAGALTAATPGAAQTWSASTGMGSVNRSRGSKYVYHDGVKLTGENSIFGKMDTTSWARQTAAGTAWQGGRWLGWQMAGDGWTGTSWTARTWGATTWPGVDWGRHSWIDDNWADNTWTSGGWTGHYWSGHYWSGDTWSTGYWR